MKKLLIINNNLRIGGVQKALVNLLWNIRDSYDITLLLFSKTGECLCDLPPEVKVITTNSAYRFLGMAGNEAKKITDKWGRILFAAITRVLGRQCAIWLMARGQKQLDGYDTAISYLHDAGPKAFYGGCNDFVLRHVCAKKKITFLHCDFGLCGADTPENRRNYAKFDVIAACSQGCADAFLKANPEYRQKVQVVKNCHRFEKIREDAREMPVKLQEGKINLITVARMGKEKGIDRAVRIIAALNDLGDRFHYYIVGDGYLRPQIEEQIRRFHLETQITLLGEQENPYGYMEAADLLLIPSYSEAAPLVIGEAACLGTPILSMETSSAIEMIRQTGCGWVCDNSEEAMQQVLRNLLQDPQQLKEKRAYLTQNLQSNGQAVEQFAKILD